MSRTSAIQTEENSDDDECQLPADTLAILQEFLQQNQSKDDLEENWQLSQFWYNQETKEALARAVSRILKHFYGDNVEERRIALLSSPSLFEEMKKVHSNVTLFEYDERFSRYEQDFVQYDYKRAEEAGYLKDHHGKFDILILDPPFLAQECIEKVSIITENLKKPDAKVILCSGRVVEEFAKRYLRLDLCKFRPEHERNLGNDFASYSNIDLDRFMEQ